MIACGLPRRTEVISRAGEAGRRSVRDALDGVFCGIACENIHKLGRDPPHPVSPSAPRTRRTMQGWLPILIMIGLGAAFGFGSVMLSKFLGPKKPTPEKLAPY